MKPKRIEPVEFTTDANRLVFRYTHRFVVRTAVTLAVLTIVAAALLGFPISAAVRGRFLEVITPAVFSLCIGLPLAVCAIAGWSHLLAFRRRELVFDHNTQTCTVPVGLRGKCVLPIGDIKRIRLERKRSLPGVYRNIDSPELWSTHVIERQRVVLVLSDSATQVLWGRLGLTNSAEKISEMIAAFLNRDLQICERT